MATPLKSSDRRATSAHLLVHWPRAGIAIRVPPRRVAGVGTTCEVIAFAGATAQPPRTVAWDALATAVPRASRTVLLVAAEDVSFTVADVPNLSGLRLREALPNLVEDKTVGDVGSLHVALGQRVASATDDRTRVLAVVDRTWLAAIQVHVARSGLRLAAVLPESLAVPKDADAWSLAAGGGTDAGSGPRPWLRHGAQEAVPLPDAPDAAAAVVGAMLRAAGNDRVQRIDLYAAASIKPHVKAIGEAVARETRLALHDAGADPFVEWLARDGPDGAYGAPLSLLSSEGMGSDGTASWRRWRLAAALAVAVVAVQLAGMHWQWAGLRANAAALRADAAKVLTSTFPETRVVQDAPLQMTRGLATLRASAGRNDPGDFTAMTAAVARIFAALPSNALRGIDYDARAMRIRVAPSTVAGDLQQRLVAQALQEGYVLRFEPAAASGETIASLRVQGDRQGGRS